MTFPGVLPWDFIGELEDIWQDVLDILVISVADVKDLVLVLLLILKIVGRFSSTSKS